MGDSFVPILGCLFLASIFLGYLSHIFMDGWTHSSGIFVHVFPLLKHRIAGEGNYHWLQYGFSLLGLFIPALILLSRFIQWRQMSRLPERVQSVAAPSAKVLLWACAVGMGTLLFLLKCYFAYDRLWLGIFIVSPDNLGLVWLVCGFTAVYGAAEATFVNWRCLLAHVRELDAAVQNSCSCSAWTE